ncbi:MAG: 3-phosphoshikimate 1-carboxyvinyltransferase [Bryobacterales bacterium]|nr:3-phosphoshikimate 1-carboxyvinyltransferase [Bryobacterales bacterium]
MDQRITPAKSVGGAVTLPGDKSISHRLAILASIAEGKSRILNYSTGADCQSTLGCLRALGVEIEKTGDDLTIRGRGLGGLRAPLEVLDAGNSGSTIRMLSGVLAAQPFASRIGGDDSLSRRPMERIMRPLGEMGASIRARDGKFPPLEITGTRLRAIDYTLPVASAQVKTCVLFAGLFARGRTTVQEPVRTRDHSEIALREFGAGIDVQGPLVSIQGGVPLAGCQVRTPGDLSSAAFFLVAALATPEANLVIRGVGLNPTRSALLDFLISMGGEIRVLNLDQSGGELVGDVLARGSRIRGGLIEKDLTAALIDEIPVLAVLGAMSENGLTVRDAQELRIKETDRIATVSENLKRMGIEAEVFPDGLRVPGRQRFRAAEVESFGDHRIAMAFAVAALFADGETLLRGAEAAAVSYPEFFATLRNIAG